jgi:hypothetical protein
VVQQISSAVVKQIPSTATLDLVCRTRKRLDNQRHEPNCAAPTAREHNDSPYVPGRRAEALAFTLSVTVTPLVSMTPWVGLAVSQDGVLIE